MRKMITVMLNEAGFEYDIHSLVRAFYPMSEVKVFVEGEKELVSDAGFPVIRIARSSEKIVIRLEPSPLDEGKDSRVSAVRKELLTKPGLAKEEIRNGLKQLIYQVLSDQTGKELPWGTLTGIRPAKIAMGLLEQGKTQAQILQHMQDTYYLSSRKGQLCIEIAEREKELLSGIHYRDGYSLYIGIPFCPTTCLYCSFTSYPISGWKERVSAYLSALEKELEDAAEAFLGQAPDSIYIGGGTPTTLSPQELERLLAKLQSCFPLECVQEFTVEAGRADSITREKLQVLKRYGVTRISVNPQTMREETLRLIGRQHTAEQVARAFDLARECGFDNINMDLILGLPGEGEEDVRYTTEEVRKMGPDSLTVHSLAVKRASRLSRWIAENKVSVIQNTDTMMDIAAQTAASMGMQPYYLYRQKNMSGNFENVGYAKPGCYGIYNILMMEEKQTIVALGAGSISKRVWPDGRIERCENVKEVTLYIEKIDEMIERKRKLLEA